MPWSKETMFLSCCWVFWPIEKSLLEHDFGEVGVIVLKLSQFYCCVLSALAFE